MQSQEAELIQAVQADQHLSAEVPEDSMAPREVVAQLQAQLQQLQFQAAAFESQQLQRSQTQQVHVEQLQETLKSLATLAMPEGALAIIQGALNPIAQPPPTPSDPSFGAALSSQLRSRSSRPTPYGMEHLEPLDGEKAPTTDALGDVTTIHNGQSPLPPNGKENAAPASPLQPGGGQSGA